MTTHPAILTALLRNPHDPDLRIAYAGAVEDGKCELPAIDLRGGEVVHDQYGVPLRVRCTMATWCGPLKCSLCKGDGHHRLKVQDGLWMRNEIGGTCRPCNGTGQVEGIAAAVCGAWPITGVEFSEVKPNGPPFGTWQLWDEPATVRGMPDNGDIQEVLFDLIAEGERSASYRFIDFPTEAAALAALSHAALAYGRRAAGLPDLPFVAPATVTPTPRAGRRNDQPDVPFGG